MNRSKVCCFPIPPLPNSVECASSYPGILRWRLLLAVCYSRNHCFLLATIITGDLAGLVVWWGNLFVGSIVSHIPDKTQVAPIATWPSR